MPPLYDIVTFDCYGTLIDWESGITRAFVDAAHADGVALDPSAIVNAYAEAEREGESGKWRPYREVLVAAAVGAAATLGWDISPERAAFLPTSLSHWGPFEDTNPALQRLRDAGYRLGILSNVDRDLLAATRKHFVVDFDLLVTAEDVRSYKPSFGHFTATRQWIGDARWLHAAQSSFHDIVPANALRIDTAWVNRHGRAPLPGGVPKYEVRDLSELPL